MPQLDVPSLIFTVECIRSGFDRVPQPVARLVTTTLQCIRSGFDRVPQLTRWLFLLLS